MIAAALAVGCSGGAAHDEPPAAPAGRVNAVAPKKAAVVDVREWCEPWAEAEQARAFSYPALAAGTPTTGARRWVNVWATWCAPCIEELPRLVAWRQQLAERGTPTDLVLLSVDGDPAAVAEFRTAHPEVAGSLEIGSAEAMAPWLGSLGLAEGSVLPIHLFVDEKDRLRCVRMAGVGESDFEAVRQVLARL